MIYKLELELIRNFDCLSTIFLDKNFEVCDNQLNSNTIDYVIEAITLQLFKKLTS